MNELLEIVKVGRLVNSRDWNSSDVICKLFEEGGELAQAIQIKNGRMSYKIQEIDADIEECADVIQCAIDAISQVNKNLNPEELINKLKIALCKKTEKWKNIIEKQNATRTPT